MGKVHQIVVENFKSYAGRVEVGPFKQFTCIVGPNGSGKSNLMDAISFVLGVQARQLRSERLRDLVYRREGEDPKTNQRSAAVELTYVADDAGEPQIGCPGTLVFKRTILRGGEARFYVNDHSVTQAAYHKELESINILSKVRNFLVFQGDVEAVAARQGKDLTAFFEQISGSEAYKQEYEQLASEKAKREENARYLFTKKRNALNEKKRISQQKDEADEYRKVESDRANLQLEFYLFRLHGLAQQLDEVSNARAKVFAERDAMQSALNRQQQGLDSAERERAQVHLAAQQAERDLANSKAKLDKIIPERVSARNRIAFLEQRIGELQENKGKDASKQEKLEAQVELLRTEQATLETEERGLNESVRQLELTFTPEWQREFQILVQETERITVASHDSVRQLEHQIRGLVAEKAQTDNDYRERLDRQKFLQARVGEFQQQLESARLAVVEDDALVSKKSATLEQLRRAMTLRANEKDQLQTERQELVDAVQDMAATEQQIKRERELASVCADLAGAVSGVHGRVIDSCRPVQKRLHVAVNVALGKYLDAVIVDSFDVARACVRYLKERMLPPMTFLPLSELRVNSIDPRLGELVNNDRSARLALNCVTFDERVARAFEFILSGTVICDTMADGRQLAFGQARSLGLKCRVVTLAGEAIAKNGNLSVNSEAAREGATRFDLCDQDASRSRLDVIDRRLREIHQEDSAVGADVTNLKNDIQRAEAKRNEDSVRLTWNQQQVTEKSSELLNVDESIQTLLHTRQKLESEESGFRSEKRDLEQKHSKAVAGYYAKLSNKMGVPDVQRIEREWRCEKERAQSRSDGLTRQLRNVRAELKMLEQTLRESATNVSVSIEELLPKLQADLRDVNEQEAQLAQISEVLNAETEKFGAKYEACLDTERDKERLLQGLRSEVKEQKQHVIAAEKRVSDLDSEQRSFNAARADLFRQSLLEDVELPLLRGSTEILQSLLAEPTQTVSAPVQGDPDCNGEAAVALVVDFSALPEKHQEASVGPAAKLIEDEYRAELERLKVEMRRLSPNLKAIEQAQGVAENVQVASKEADLACREIKDIDSQFEKIRQVRKDKFLDCFTKVAGEIGKVYKRLTANTAGLHSEGGNAYLDLEDTEDPFNGGIKFTAMPPAKRFRDMHLLSGGEKTLAAMALLFAVHAYQRPPFMVLDEVDAALDANNVSSLAGYVEQADCQTIVISLKDRFFVRGEALVGVWKNKPKETSAILTLDLSKYLPAQVS